MEISNSPTVCIENSTFTNNTSCGYGMSRFSGNAGGVAIGYDDIPGHVPPDTSPSITITGCIFQGNTANATENNTLTVLSVLSNRTYNQRGGGMALYFGAMSYDAVVRVENSCFINNTAQDSGGGIYMFLSGNGSAHNVTIFNTDFIRNRAQDGGGLEITHSNVNSSLNPHSIDVTECMFEKNWGKFGGGFKNIQLNDHSNSNSLTVTDTDFCDNEADVGAGIYLQSVSTVERATLQKRIFIQDW